MRRKQSGSVGLREVVQKKFCLPNRNYKYLHPATATQKAGARVKHLGETRIFFGCNPHACDDVWSSQLILNMLIVSKFPSTVLRNLWPLSATQCHCQAGWHTTSSIKIPLFGWSSASYLVLCQPLRAGQHTTVRPGLTINPFKPNCRNQALPWLPLNEVLIPIRDITSGGILRLIFETSLVIIPSNEAISFRTNDRISSQKHTQQAQIHSQCF